MKINPDIISVPEDQPSHVYDVILGVKTMAKLGVVLDFLAKTVTLDNVTLPILEPDVFLGFWVQSFRGYLS